MKQNKKNLAQYLLAGIITFFGGRAANAEQTKSATPESTPITAQNTASTNRPAFAQVSLPQQNTPTNKVTAVTVDSAVALEQGRALYDQARGLLCLNEGCRTNCYRCSEQKVTLGTGCNIQDFYFVLQSLNLPLICPQKNGRLEALMGQKRDLLCAQLADMQNNCLVKHTPIFMKRWLNVSQKLHQNMFLSMGKQQRQPTCCLALILVLSPLI